MRMKTNIIVLLESDLASRAKARNYREAVNQIITRGNRVEFDFSNVFSISDSFADELFGVLAYEIGRDGISDYIKVINAKDSIYKVIALNILNRLNQNVAA
ncbi:MAG: hypothetical protein DIZ80_10455 [endosymbiont of Galathealinum brachiosum]|uniref:DUF4325 domain-containing protein n=1 Tax=endosymbiont of Galathealinum brachiosum TaxID=2200906 RepID=A0A370DCP7_9GAMM|nr:MAG: hypothetical protein DIZ80_10455 [endosymbiont of Galathealinum brachiosum]